MNSQSSQQTKPQSSTAGPGVSEAAWPKLEIGPDEMSAELVFPPRYSRALPETEDWLKKEGVVFGVKKEVLANAAAAASKSGKPWTATIARGRTPVEGGDGRVEFFFTRRLAGDAEKIDFHESGKILTVEKDQVLAELHPPTEGVPGMTVTGREIPPQKKRGTPARLSAGGNVRHEGNKFIAVVAGAVDASSSKIRVMTDLTINEDVDYTVGNIHFNGPITIRGSIMPGFVVKTEGRVTVSDVDDAYLSAGGNIIVQHGCVGKGKTVVVGRGNIQAGFIENSKVEANGDITVKSHIVHSEVYADGNIHVSRGKGVVAGGVVRAVRGIDVCVLGSESTVQTLAAITEPRQVVERLSRIAVQIQQTEENIRKIRMAVGEKKLDIMLTHPEKMDAEHFGPQFAVFEKLLKEYHSLQDGIKALKKARENIISENAAVEKGVIRVKTKVFPGVTIQIAHFRLEIESDIPGATFSADMQEGEIRVSS